MMTRMHGYCRHLPSCTACCGATGSVSRSAASRQAERFIRAWKAAGFRVLEHLVWRKRYPSSTGFVRRYHEQAYLLAKGNPHRPQVLIPSVLEWRYTTNALHPTQKPVGTLMPLIMAFSQIGDVVLDPFAESGSTAAAAAMLGRHYIAIELSAEYAKIAHKRLQTGKLSRYVAHQPEGVPHSPAFFMLCY